MDQNIPQERLKECRKQANALYFEHVPNAHEKGLPGAPGWNGDSEPPNPNQILLDEVVAVLKEVRPYLPAEKKEEEEKPLPALEKPKERRPIERPPGWKGKMTDPFLTRNTRYGMEYFCTTCGKRNLGMGGGNNHWNWCPRYQSTK